MFKPVSMSKVNLFLLNNNLKQVTEILYDLKLMEFFEVNHEKFSRPEIPDINNETAEVLKLRSIITILKEFYVKQSDDLKSYSINDILKLKLEYDELKKQKLHFKDELNRIKVLNGLKLKKEDLKNKNLVIGFINNVEDKYFFKNLTAKKIKFNKFKLGKRIYFKFIIGNKKIDLVFKEFYLPEKYDTSVNKKLAEVKEKLVFLKNDLIKAANSSLKIFQKDELKLTKEISSLQVRHKFANTKNIVVISGFIPSKLLKRLKFSLEKELANDIVIESKIEKKNAPILLNNNGISNNFEALISMYSLPKYTEIDPTYLMYLIFPIFFGFILGDVVYGIISLIFFTIIKYKFKKVKDFISILQISAISSIFFGFIYGEFMGFELEGPFYGFFSRAHDPQMLLIIAIIFGAIHINLGLILGFINEAQNSIKHAVCDKASWMVLQIAVILLALGYYASNQTSILVGWIFFILALILIYMGHGFIGIIEVPSFFTNIFSYARLMAVGLSSIAIAVLVNDYSQVLFAKGIFGSLFAIILFTFGHIFNIVLGNFEGFIHTMRLHYVEFFTKFYRGGGSEFKPFGKN